MCEAMRWINYYENILEFKEMTGGQLLLGEVQNLRLCKICLIHTNFAQDDVYIVGSDGKLLDIEQMLADCAGIQKCIADVRLAKLICKDCVQKLSTLYFFRLQAQRAQKIIERLLEKLNAADSTVDTTTTNEIFCEEELQADSESQDTTVKHTLKSNIHNNDKDEDSTEETFALKLGTSSNTDELVEDDTSYDFVNIESNQCESSKQKDHSEDSLQDEYSLKELDQNEQEYVYEYEDVDNDTEITVENTNIQQIKSEEVTQGDAKEQEEDTQTTFSHPVEVKQSTKKSNKPLLDNLRCALCDKDFTMQRLLLAHVNRAHPNVKAFKCRECGSMFSHLQSLSRHMRTHKPGKSKSVCELCGKAFLRGDDWKRHMRIHTGERPYACHLCDKAFKQVNELKEHQLTHMKNKMYECDICGVRLSSRNGMYIHKKAHAGIKNFSCEECGKRFITNGELKAHRNVHAKKAKNEAEK